MALAEPPGDLDYLLDELDDPDEDFELDDDFGFAPYQPPSLPWYRTTAAVVAMSAIGLAVIAILVSAVLLVSRNSRGQTNDVETTTIATTPSSATTIATTPSSATTIATTPPLVATVPPPPPAESPSPTEPTASAPVVVAPPRHSEPKKPPEIGVTRTPVTREPISVRPPPVPHF